MKKIYFVLSLLFLAVFTQAQTSLITASDGGFETGSTFAANGWTVANDATTTWNVGAVPGWFTGTAGAYVSNNGGTTWAYTNSLNQRSHFYRDISFPAAQPVVRLDFDVRCYGETGYDQLLVYIADNTVTPTNAGPAGTATTVTGWPGYTNGTTGYFLTAYNGTVTPTTTTHVSYTFTAAQAAYVAGNTKRLIFTWKNDNSLGTNPPAAVDNITLISSCSGPTLNATSAITSSGATLNWSAIAGATGYTVQYRVAGAVTWINAAGNPYGSNSAVLTGLSASTNYEFQVAATGPVCNAYSAIGTFTTACGAPTLPWTEGFEGVATVGANIFPNCWARELITGTNSPGTYATNDAYREPHSGAKLLYTQYNTTAWVYTPGFAVTAGVAYRFSFWMKNKTVTNPVDFVMDVKYGNAQASASMTNNLQSGYSATNANWQQFSYIFTPTTTGTIYIGIKSTSATFTPWYLSFDDFKMELAPTCTEPINVTASAITFNGATLSWSPGAIGTAANGYDYYVSTSSTTPTVSTTPTGSTAAGVTTVNVTGLSASTNYYAWVRSKCSSTDISDWSGVTTFTTPCQALLTLSWSEGFEGVATVGANIFPNCWARELITGTNSPGTYGTNDTYREPHTGTKLLYTQYSTTAWVYTPGFAVSAGVQYSFSFWMKNKVVTNPVDFIMDVKYGNAQASASMTNNLQAGYVANNAAWQQFTYTFTAATSGNIYFGIKSTSTTFTPWFLSFDDFQFTQVTPCPSASTAVSYGAAGYCTSSGSATPTITGATGGAFTSTTGLTLNAGTGAITPTTSTPGSYVVTYTVTGAGACGNLVRTANVTITAPASGTFSYAAGPYCSTVTSVTPTPSTLSAGGTYSSTTGLSISPASGVINPSLSTGGTYTVTYTVAAAGGCPAYSTTASVTITTAPNATLSYGAAPICQSSTTANPVLTGSTGGAYSSTAGLTINGTTGVINPSTSTAGTYTVTYTVAAAGGCAVFSTTASVTINTLSVQALSASATNPNICGTNGTTNLTVAGGTLGSGASYKWYADGCGSGAVIGTGTTLTGIQVFHTTTFYVRAEGTCNTTNCVSVTVNVNPAPSVVLTAGSNAAVNPFTHSVLQTTVSPSGTYVYQYKKDGVILNNLNTQIIPLTPDSVGTYTVTVFNTVTGCSATSNAVTITADPGSQLFITPNPNSGKFQVRYYAAPATFGTARTVSVFDGKGSRVSGKEMKVSSGYQIVDFDLTKNARGTYTVKVTDASGKIVASGQILIVP